MIQEIKFRAWDEGNNVMHYDFQFIRSGVDGNDWIVFQSDRQHLDFHNPNPFFSQQLKVMQYTGLKDKNGKEIYEGDIMDFDEKEWGGKFKPEIILMGNIIGQWGYCGSLSDVTEWRQVIGNIYENPELLNK